MHYDMLGALKQGVPLVEYVQEFHNSKDYYA
jgi:hypothetical protein